MSTHRWLGHHMAMRDKVLSFILEFSSAHGYSPTYREIAEATDIRSTSTVSSYVHELIADGALSSDCSKPRTLSAVNADADIETVQQRICVRVANGGKVYMDYRIEKPKATPVRVSFDGILDAKALKSHVCRIVGVNASEE